MEFVPTAKLGFSPLDDELELLPGSLTPSLQESLVRLGAWIPFEPAGRLLVDFMGLGALSAPFHNRLQGWPTRLCGNL